MGKAPAFQMYASDFLIDTAQWTDREVGIYIRLLFTEWVNGELEPERLETLVESDKEKFLKAWKIVKRKFKVNDNGMLINERLESTREKQNAWIEKSRKGGLQSAKQRATKRATK